MNKNSFTEKKDRNSFYPTTPWAKTSDWDESVSLMDFSLYGCWHLKKKLIENNRHIFLMNQFTLPKGAALLLCPDPILLLSCDDEKKNAKIQLRTHQGRVNWLDASTSWRSAKDVLVSKVSPLAVCTGWSSGVTSGFQMPGLLKKDKHHLRGVTWTTAKDPCGGIRKEKKMHFLLRVWQDRFYIGQMSSLLIRPISWEDIFAKKKREVTVRAAAGTSSTDLETAGRPAWI